MLVARALGAKADRNSLFIAVRLAGRILDHTALDHPGRAGRMSNLAIGLMRQSLMTGKPADLDLAVDLARQAAEAPGPGRVDYLSNLVEVLDQRRKMLSAPDGLEEAIERRRECIDLLGEDSRLPAHLGNYGLDLFQRFLRDGTVGDLDRAVEASRRALRLLPNDHSERSRHLNALGLFQRHRFETVGEIADLLESVRRAEESVSLPSAESSERGGQLANLSVSLRLRYSRLGSPADLDRAIHTGREALEAMPSNDPERVAALADLGVALRTRFELRGGRADVEAAVRLGERALADTPSDHPFRGARLGNLGISLQLLFGRTGDLADLDRAIAAAREALALRGDRLDRKATLNDLGLGLRLRFEHSGEISDLDASISNLREAIDGQDDDQHRPMRLNSLCGSLQARYEVTGDPGDLDAAVAMGSTAVEATPSGDRAWTAYAVTLSSALRARFERTSDSRDRDLALRLLGSVTDAPFVAPSIRIPALRLAAELAMPDQVGRAAALTEAAVLQLPDLALRELDRGDRQHLIRGVSGLASYAASLALSDPGVREKERPGRALRLLEAGRSVLLTQSLAIRNDYTDLRDAHPGLAAELASLRSELDRSPTVRVTAGVFDTRHEQSDRLTRLLDHIRNLHGFETFGLPPTEKELRSQARQDAIVTFAISPLRSDALITTEQAITNVALPLLEQERLIGQINAFHQALAILGDAEASFGERISAQRRLLEILAWLWDAAAEPVLEALGIEGPPEDAWPRLWWSPGGLLGLLPLHAAGHHFRSPDPTHRAVLDRVVSSYTPTINALRYARGRSSRSPGEDWTLLVAMPETPAQVPLPMATQEVETLRGLLPRPTLVQARPVTGAAVLSALPGSTIVHFACHGRSDPADPSQSRLLLHDWKSAPLTVAALAPVDHDRARLAYLSACSTAVTRDTQLLDESIHLASAFQLAGFPHVIATLWTIPDDSAVAIAGSFYERLCQSGRPATEDSAHALHQTINALRSEEPLALTRWGAHVHFGA
ncbi:CHAT domain-containing protein [Actinomadura citrea]|nr:CHAT domain-containing protein [Actinomadura citrea]